MTEPPGFARYCDWLPRTIGRREISSMSEPPGMLAGAHARMTVDLDERRHGQAAAGEGDRSDRCRSPRRRMRARPARCSGCRARPRRCRDRIRNRCSRRRHSPLAGPPVESIRPPSEMARPAVPATSPPVSKPCTLMSAVIWRSRPAVKSIEPPSPPVLPLVMEIRPPTILRSPSSGGFDAVEVDVARVDRENSHPRRRNWSQRRRGP